MRFAFVALLVIICPSVYAAAPTPPADSSARSKPPTPAENVNVLNFPSVQSVAGHVNVANLPFATDGSLLVTSTSAPQAQPVSVDLVSETIEVSGTTVLATVDTRGFSRFGCVAVVPQSPYGVSMTFDWRWSDDEPFGRVDDYRFPQSCPRFSVVNDSARMNCNVEASQLRITLDVPSYAPPSAVTLVRVYLFP